MGNSEDFVCCFLLQTLSPLQMARCVVRSFPWYPDIPAITTWIAAQHGDPEAQKLLRALAPDLEL